jgi:hypothetical protein
MSQALGGIIIFDALISLANFTPNNHDNFWLEAGRWLRLAIGMTLVLS